MKVLLVERREYEYLGCGFSGMPTFFTSRWEEEFINNRFLEWLEKEPDNSSISVGLADIYKHGDQLIWQDWETKERDICDLSLAQYTFLVKELLELQSLKKKGIIFLFEGKDRYKKLLFDQIDYMGLAYHNYTVHEFGVITLTPLALILKMGEAIWHKIVKKSLSEHQCFNNKTISIKLSNNLVTIENLKHEKIYGPKGKKIRFAHDAFIWIVETYFQLAREPFEHILFYQTPEKYVFMKDIDTEIVFEPQK